MTHSSESNLQNSSIKSSQIKEGEHPSTQPQPLQAEAIDTSFIPHAHRIPIKKPFKWLSKSEQSQTDQAVQLQDFNSNIDIQELVQHHPLSIPRNLAYHHVHKLEEKAQIIDAVISKQKEHHLYTLDRYPDHASNNIAHIKTPDNRHNQSCIMWCTNLYLGLNRHPKLIKKAKSMLDDYGTGSGTSSVSGGLSQIHISLQDSLSKFLHKESTVLFSTGFTANLGAISALASAKDFIIFDKECHSSMIEGIKLSGARFKSFKNNDAKHLERILSSLDFKQYSNVFVLTESVFGMTGETSPLNLYCKLKETYPFYLYVDEAHSMGIFGKKGQGYAASLGCLHQVDFLMSTLSKAFGSVGGFVATNTRFANYIKHASNAYLFQASMPPQQAACCLEALQIIQENQHIQKKLWQNAQLFAQELRTLGFDIGKTESPIVPIYIKNEEKLAKVCKELYMQGIFTNWISYPAVPKGKGRLRFIVSSLHTKNDIFHTCDCLKKAAKKFSII